MVSSVRFGNAVFQFDGANFLDPLQEPLNRDLLRGSLLVSMSLYVGDQVLLLRICAFEFIESALMLLGEFRTSKEIFLPIGSGQLAFSGYSVGHAWQFTLSGGGRAIEVWDCHIDRFVLFLCAFITALTQDVEAEGRFSLGALLDRFPVLG